MRRWNCDRRIGRARLGGEPGILPEAERFRAVRGRPEGRRRPGPGLRGLGGGRAAVDPDHGLRDLQLAGAFAVVEVAVGLAVAVAVHPQRAPLWSSSMFLRAVVHWLDSAAGAAAASLPVVACWRW